MESIRFFSFIPLLFMIILVLNESSTAHTHVMKRSILAAHGRNILANTGKEVYDAVPVAAEVVNSKLGRKKMILPLTMAEQEDKGNEIPGAGQTIGKVSHKGKGVLNVNRKLRNRNPHRRHGKPKVEGFTAFSADYHVPRSHPPKNN